MTATTITSVPKNKTGLFAGDTLQEAKPTRNQSNIGPGSSSPSRHTGPVNLLLTPSEQRRLSKNGIQQYYSSDRNSSTTNDSYVTANSTRNGFRPSTIRRQKSRLTTAMIHRDNNDRDLKDSPSKQSFTPSIASARLKSEIDQLNRQLKIYGDVNKILRIQQNRDITATPLSALSYATTCRLSSASTNPTTTRLHQRLPSTMTNEALSTLISISGITDTSNKSIVATSSPFNEEDYNQVEIDHPITHAYQIPQQSNVGTESIFPFNSSSSTTIGTRSTINNRRSNENKPISCPFYVMYLTNLAMQQRTGSNNENNRAPSSMSTATTRRGTISSRYQSARRQIYSPISINTSSTIDDDNDSLINTTSYYNNKRFSAKITAFEHENSHMLKNILRTTSWNHVQV